MFYYSRVEYKGPIYSFPYFNNHVWLHRTRAVCHATVCHPTVRTATPQCAMPQWTTPRHSEPDHSTPRQSALHHGTVCHTTARYATAHHATVHYATVCRTTVCQTTKRHATPQWEILSLYLTIQVKQWSASDRVSVWGGCLAQRYLSGPTRSPGSQIHGLLMAGVTA